MERLDAGTTNDRMPEIEDQMRPSLLVTTSSTQQ